MKKNDSIVVRNATADDEWIVRPMFLSMLKELATHGHDILPTENNAELFWSGIFIPAIISGEHSVLVSEYDGAPIGMIAVVPELKPGNFDHPQNRAMDWGCYVNPEYRRRGVATMLRRAAITRMRELEYDSIISHIRAGNIAGMQSYLKVGGETVGFQVEIKL